MPLIGMGIPAAKDVVLPYSPAIENPLDAGSVVCIFRWSLQWMLFLPIFEFVPACEIA